MKDKQWFERIESPDSGLKTSPSKMAFATVKLLPLTNRINLESTLVNPVAKLVALPPLHQAAIYPPPRPALQVDLVHLC